jgi:hypothetical protein
VIDELGITTTWGHLSNSGGVKLGVLKAHLERAQAIVHSCLETARKHQTETPSEEHAEHVMVKVEPGAIQTSVPPTPAPAEVEEENQLQPSGDQLITNAARATLFLAASFSSYLSSSTLTISCGAPAIRPVVPARRLKKLSRLSWPSTWRSSFCSGFRASRF